MTLNVITTSTTTTINTNASMLVITMITKTIVNIIVLAISSHRKHWNTEYIAYTIVNHSKDPTQNSPLLMYKSAGSIFGAP